MFAAVRIGFYFFASLMFVVAIVPLRGADTKPSNDNRELHVVSIYEGVEKTGNEIHGGRAKVTVDRPGAKVTLALSAYERVTWEVVLTPNTKLEKVILGGHEAQALKAVPEGVELVKAFRDQPEPHLYYCYKIDSPDFRALVHQVGQLSKLPIASFQGAYRYQHETPFVVDQIQDDERLSSDYPQPTPLAELPELTFKALHHAGGDEFPFRSNASYGDFTLAGPSRDTLKPLPAGVGRLTFDPANKKHYGIAGHNLVEVDLVKRMTTVMDLGFDVPRLSWPSDVTFDTKRGILIVATRHVRGYLYAYDVAAAKWSVISENAGCSAVTYHSKHDCLYGIAMDHGEEGRARLRQFNSEGALLKETVLGKPIIPGVFGRHESGVSGLQVAPADEFLAIVYAPIGYRGERLAPRMSYIFLVDPKAEKVWLTAKESLPEKKAE